VALLNLSPVEIAIIAIAAIVVFGRRLPQVAGQAAGAVQRLRRSLDDLRRETGIDREIQEARRAVESAVPREVRSLDVRTLAREAQAEVKRAVSAPTEGAPRSTEESKTGEVQSPERPQPPAGSEGAGSGGSGV